MASLPLYLFATRQAGFHGTLPERKIPEIAKLIGRSPASTKRQLIQLAELGMCEKKGKTWMFVNGEFFTATCGRTRVKMVRLEQLERSYLTTLCYSVFITENGRKIAHNESKKHASTKSDGVKNVSIACAYTANYIKRSIQTVSKRRKAAKSLGLIDYSRTFKHVLSGGENVKMEFSAARSSGNTKPADLLFEQKTGFLWVNELPATFSSLLPLRVHSIRSIPLKKMARQRWINR